MQEQHFETAELEPHPPKWWALTCSNFRCRSPHCSGRCRSARNPEPRGTGSWTADPDPRGDCRPSKDDKRSFGISKTRTTLIPGSVASLERRETFPLTKKFDEASAHARNNKKYTEQLIWIHVEVYYRQRRQMILNIWHDLRPSQWCTHDNTRQRQCACALADLLGLLGQLSVEFSRQLDQFVHLLLGTRAVHVRQAWTAITSVKNV